MASCPSRLGLTTALVIGYALTGCVRQPFPFDSHEKLTPSRMRERLLPGSQKSQDIPPGYRETRALSDYYDPATGELSIRGPSLEKFAVWGANEYITKNLPPDHTVHLAWIAGKELVNHLKERLRLRLLDEWEIEPEIRGGGVGAEIKKKW